MLYHALTLYTAPYFVNNTYIYIYICIYIYSFIYLYI